MFVCLFTYTNLVYDLNIIDATDTTPSIKIKELKSIRHSSPGKSTGLYRIPVKSI